MTEKELKKLNRYQLLELIIMQTEQIQELEVQLKQAQAQIDAQEIRIAEAGSIAEASLQLSGIFEAAQAAADIYLENVRKQTTDADIIRENARLDAARMTQEAEQYIARITAEADEKIAQMTEDAHALLEDAHLRSAEQLHYAEIAVEEAEKKAAKILADTTAICAEKEKSINAYIASIQASFHSQFQSLDQLSQSRAAQNGL